MDKKKLGLIIFLVVCMIILAICIIIQGILNKETKGLKNESEKFKTTVTTTKSGTEVETQYIHIENNKFFLKVPTSFKKLNTEEINQKYSGEIPDVAYSNDDGTINVAISITERNMKNDDVNNYKTSIEEKIKSDNEIIVSNYYEVDNHNVGQIKFISKIGDSNIYNDTIFFSYNDKLVTITFNCMQDLQEEWQGVGDFIINSLFFA